MAEQQAETVAQALRRSAALLDAISDTPRLDAELLMAHACATDRSQMLLRCQHQPVPASFAALLARRTAHEPVAYIIGMQEFYGLALAVSPAVLIPRADSETLIEAARIACAKPPEAILDLGSGSGALLLAALSLWPDARGLGIDQSPSALAIAQGNAARLGFGARASFQPGDWGAGIAGRFDLILCNPPYVEADADLAPSVRDHEPASALFAGADGLDDYRRLIPQLPGLLAPGGVAALEIGWKQADAVTSLAANAAMHAALHHDLGGRPRALLLHM